MRGSLILAIGTMAAALAIPLVSPASAQQGPGFAGAVAAANNHQGQNWRLLAFKTVGAGTDRDVIQVRTDRFWRQIQLCSINAPIHMQDFDVIYRNGRREDVRVRERINAGTCTRAIDLRGGQRRITQIQLKYGKIDRSMRVPLIRVMAR